MKYPFNKPFLCGVELKYIAESVLSGKISGDGIFTKKCQDFLKRKFQLNNSLLTTSCTDALEIAALALNIKAGDEVIMPSYTFVSTANAFVLRGAIPIFIDSESSTPNIDVSRIEERITARTKAIVVVHYAGIACDMMGLNALSIKYGVPLIEDAAQAIGAKYKDTYLGSFGALSTFSFHETKNINCGEGGAIVINDLELYASVEKIREKGTNRSLFLRGEVDKYTWVSLGSSFLPSDLLAAYLYGQFENYEIIQSNRLMLWSKYNNIFSEFQSKYGYTVPFIPEYATGNAHIFYLIVNNMDYRTRIIDRLKANSILTVSHYVPLHSSPVGRQFSDVNDPSISYKNCDRYADCLIRMPLYHELTTADIEMICERTLHIMSQIT